MIGWLILFAFGVSGVITALINENDFLQPSYFKTSQFQDEIGELTEYIHGFEISYQSKEEMKEAITVSKDEVEKQRFQYGNLTEQIRDIEQQYQSRIAEAKENNNQTVVDLYIKDRDKKIEEITTNFESDESIKKKIVTEKEENIDKYFKELENYRDEYETYQEAFVYYLKNPSTGEVYTNLPSKDSKLVDQYINDENMYFVESFPNKKQIYLKISNEPLVRGYEDFVDLPRTNSNDLFEGKIGVSKDTPATNMIMQAYNSYDDQRIFFWINTVAAIIALIPSVIIGKRIRIITKIAPSKWQSKYNKVPFDIALLLLGSFAFISLELMKSASFIRFNFDVEEFIINLLFLTLFIGLTMIQVIYLYHRLKSISTENNVWKNTVIGRVLKMFRNAFQRVVNLFRNTFLNRRVGTQVFLILIIVFLFGILTTLIFVDQDFLALYIPAFFIVGVPMFIHIVRKTGYFNQILNYTKAAALGEFEPDLKITGKSVLAKLVGDINLMKYGVKKSQKAQAKSERLKTELITNVSHDLRTPLTSIITYSELLKNPEITEEERGTYIEIIDRKSKRLKVLIDDLFEASKMASGAIELSKQKVDIVQLLQQSLAEYTETMEKSQIQFRISTPEHPVYAIVDGQKLWRSFENIIGNMIKYSLENTRAFINVKSEQNQVIITFKNISKYELNENSDDLFERFKRGDESRHTEGSGLGLAIAKSIIDLHEGTLDIDIDGDLFKVTIILAQLDH
jgi:signal transduction histidine kinase